MIQIQQTRGERVLQQILTRTRTVFPTAPAVGRMP